LKIRLFIFKTGKIGLRLAIKSYSTSTKESNNSASFRVSSSSLFDQWPSGITKKEKVFEEIQGLFFCDKAKKKIVVST